MEPDDSQDMFHEDDFQLSGDQDEIADVAIQAPLNDPIEKRLAVTFGRFIDLVLSNSNFK